MTRLLFGLATAVAVLVIGFLHRAAVDAGGDSLASADGEWLVVAASATLLMWIVGTIAHLGSMPLLPPFGRLFVVQMGASFANHVLPAGVGGMAVNMRFMRRLGMSRGAAAGAVGLNSLAGLVTHLLLLAGVVAAAPSAATTLAPRVHWSALGPFSGTDSTVIAAIGVFAGVGALTWLGLRLRRRGCGHRSKTTSQLTQDLGQLRAVLRHPGRAAALWGGSVSAPLLHTLILYAVLRSLGNPVPLGTVLLVYVVVSAVCALLPAPGAIGSLDVALVAALVTAGVPSTTALASVLGYRLITAWLPLLPTACVLVVLLRRRII
ncbi:lysylphosphatidylglycerol synthase transmembrane domain-containing protein [Actinomadura opuntiae]|uniref:lysylphosphatidylglycerol synthase transmembrane domain-containing protein n=1 Tax=Actinomadura sp. OS1-43 TaxID=604315 RepID=UPI00255B14CA|nr:lysylphosphatidylglycerol synthase transmembrane domain-containing protein [Actinomadura sp. OS1-43]MDL4818671.1 lysylphosphatidylglycerol synthase transmembrane domain-containing protein [Actinomadura sp. OS1-43]